MLSVLDVQVFGKRYPPSCFLSMTSLLRLARRPKAASPHRNHVNSWRWRHKKYQYLTSQSNWRKNPWRSYYLDYICIREIFLENVSKTRFRSGWLIFTYEIVISIDFLFQIKFHVWVFSYHIYLSAFLIWIYNLSCKQINQQQLASECTLLLTLRSKDLFKGN